MQYTGSRAKHPHYPGIVSQRFVGPSECHPDNATVAGGQIGIILAFTTLHPQSPASADLMLNQWTTAYTSFSRSSRAAGSALSYRRLVCGIVLLNFWRHRQTNSYKKGARLRSTIKGMRSRCCGDVGLEGHCPVAMQNSTLTVLCAPRLRDLS